jgi:hypothetical protein
MYKRSSPEVGDEMRRIGAVLVVAVTVLAGVALPVVGGGVATAGVGGETTWEQTETSDADNGTTTAAPGTRLAGSVGVQGAELGGELEARSFAHRVNRSESNASKARVVASQTNQSRTRLAALRTARQQLEAARENGTVGENEYRVRAAKLSARTAALQRVTNRTSQTARTLPAETLRQNGVNETALERLRQEADELTGPEMAAIARSLAGPGATRGNGFGPPANASERGPRSAGPPADAPGRNDDAPGDASDRSRGQGQGQGPDERQGAPPAASDQSGNETATGRDAGNGNGSNSGSGPDGDAGSDGANPGGNGNGSDRGNPDGTGGSANTSDPGQPGSRGEGR